MSDDPTTSGTVTFTGVGFTGGGDLWTCDHDYVAAQTLDRTDPVVVSTCWKCGAMLWCNSPPTLINPEMHQLYLRARALSPLERDALIRMLEMTRR